MTNQFDNFKAVILKGQDCPLDLQGWLVNMDCCAELLEELECTVFDGKETHNLISHSYLNDNDRKDPAIMGNIKAINEVFDFATFVLEAINGDIFGYWHGQKNVTILKSPILKYDTEGQFHIMLGTTMTEALMGDYWFDEDDGFQEMKARFEACGIKIKATCYDDLKESICPNPPNVMHDVLYKKYTAKG